VTDPTPAAAQAAQARASRIIALSLVASAVLLLGLGLSFVFALGNPLIGWILVLMAVVDTGLAWYFARRAMS
jgi:hypothetical protein